MTSEAYDDIQWSQKHLRDRIYLLIPPDCRKS